MLYRSILITDCIQFARLMPLKMQIEMVLIARTRYR